VIVLGIEGALGGFSAAVSFEGKILASRAIEGNVALEGGLGALAAALNDAGISQRHLTRLAVGIGPGGFTGLRITIAYAKSLAQAWERPLVPVSSFDILEYGLAIDRGLTVVQGRTGVISARWRDASGTARASGRIADVIAELAPQLPGDAFPLVSAPEDVRTALAEAGYTVNPLVSPISPPAAAVALLGASTSPAASAHEVRADYGELPAAKVPKF
jgi:tRNA threonylcarbamoyladenosine biosynthesis protein TsaB